MPIRRTWYYSFVVLLLVHLSMQDDTNKKLLQAVDTKLNELNDKMAQVSTLDTKLNELNDKMAQVMSKVNELDKLDELLDDKLNNKIAQVMTRFNEQDEQDKLLQDKQDKLLKQAVCKLCGSNDQCTSSNNGFCNVDWNEIEDNWDISVCDLGCLHGECTGTNTCTCEEGWSGDQCTMVKAVCDLGCLHGECRAPNTCTCEEGWSGDQCDIIDLCPASEGFFTTPNGDQCFKEYRQQYRSWSAAVSHCESQDLVLAAPLDHNAGFVQKYLYDKHGVSVYWVNARGTGRSSYSWESDASVVSSAVWYPGNPDNGGGRDWCVGLYASNKNPGRPYGDYYCSYARYTLCERVMA